MRTAAIIALYLCGAAQMALGLIGGRLRIYAIEADFWHELGLAESNSPVFMKYIGIIKDQWGVLTWIGLLSILATTILLIATRDTRRESVRER